MPNPTLHDVATQAGVSDSTASRALRGTGRVSSDTRRKVQQAADAMHFSLSRNASALASGRTMRVPLLFIERANTWFNAEILEGCRQILAPQGYDIIPTVTADRSAFDAFFNDLPGNRNADAIIVTSVDLDPAKRRILDELTIPTVGLDSRSPVGFDATVQLDDADGMMQAVRLLHATNATTIGYAGAPDPPGFAFSSQLRREGFIQAANRLGWHDENVLLYDIERTDTYHSLEDIAAATATRIALSGRRPDAVCVETDEFAVALMTQLRRLGIRVPEDIGIIGFDDSSLAPVAGLTTLHHDPVQMGRRCAQQALALMNGQKLDNPYEIMRPTLITRATTASLI
jgi:DNA-binding LacI/PurR family transcriptional regulator